MKAAVVGALREPLAVDECVIGSIVGTRQDLAEVVRPHAAGRARVVRATRPPASVDDSVDEVPRGRGRARTLFGLGAGR
ncbi:hypothetical protein PV725_20165 [Streptomyces scabiei]|nr:hypothetical protein [Streptomyces scabiei]MDX3520243.1 hypothetical protein [Streptomyces scabiei]